MMDQEPGSLRGELLAPRREQVSVLLIACQSLDWAGTCRGASEYFHVVTLLMRIPNPRLLVR